MLKIKYWALAFAGASLVTTVSASDFAGTVINYDSGTGFSAGFNTSSVVLGSPTTGASVTPFAAPFRNTQILSIGAGGSLTVQFNSPILNDSTHPFGLDFSIFGNSFFVTSGNPAVATSTVFSSTTPGSTRVLVSQDGITFFALNPALAPTANILYPTDGLGDPSLPVNPALLPTDFAGQNLAGVRLLYNGSAGGSSYDISWAVDGDNNAVNLSSIDYVEVQVLTGRAQIDAFSEVPEPAAYSLLLPAFAILVWRRQPSKPASPNHHD